MNINIGKAVSHYQDPRQYDHTPLLVDSSTYLGVEVELEGIHISDVDNVCPLLASTSDYSLRGPDSGEILFAMPLKGVDIVTAVRAIETYVHKQAVRPIISSRTSTHVHMDMRSLSSADLRKLLAVYLSVERVLFHYCGKEREDNIFCVPLYKSNLTQKQIAKALDSTSLAQFKDALSVFSESVRYGALNLHSLWMHGTLEFRHLRGEYRADNLLKWINILLSIKQYALNTSTKALKAPKYTDSSYCGEFLEAVFGEYAEELKYDGYERDIVKGTRDSQNIIHSNRQNSDQWPILKIATTTTVKVACREEPITKKKKIKKLVVEPSSINAQQFTWANQMIYDPAALNAAVDELLNTNENPEDTPSTDEF